MKIKKERLHLNNFKDVMKNYLSFYNKNLRKKHIIVYIISLMIFALCVTNFINNSSDTNQFLSEVNNIEDNSNIFMTILKDKIILTALIIFAGITPYMYIPVIAIIIFPYMLAADLINMSAFNMIIACIGSVIEIFGASLAIAVGIYYCTSSTKKFRYNGSNTYGMDDVKQQIYEATKKEDKLNKLKEKRQIKYEKREKLNVKIDYKNLLITGIISIVIVSVTALITGV